MITTLLFLLMSLIWVYLLIKIHLDVIKKPLQNAVAFLLQVGID